MGVSYSPNFSAKRVMDRDGLSEKENRSRVSSQVSNKERERASHANVVFCSLWDRDFNRVQVKSA